MSKVFFSFALLYFAAVLSISCKEHLPEVVPLSPGAEQVEVVSETPYKDIYQAIGGVTAKVAGAEAQSATREARNELRNQAAQKGASLVFIDDVNTNNSFSSGGKTVVTMTGTAYKQK
jgi:hypothetical protein